MDDEHFDAMVKAWGSRANRRRTLQGLVAAAAVVLLSRPDRAYAACANDDECPVDNSHCNTSNNTCACDTGYSQTNTDPDPLVCENVDECGAGTHTCDENAVCSDTQGSYQCQCMLGFTGDGETCVADDPDPDPDDGTDPGGGGGSGGGAGSTPGSTLLPLTCRGRKKRCRARPGSGHKDKCCPKRAKCASAKSGAVSCRKKTKR